MKIKAGQDNELGLPVDTDVNALIIAEDHEFRKRGSHDRDYRTRALELVINAKVPFQSTASNFWPMCRKFIHITCPYCESPMRFSDAQSGTGDMGGPRYECPTCTCVATLRVQHRDGISFDHKRTPRPT